MLQYSSRADRMKNITFGFKPYAGKSMEEKKYIEKINDVLKTRIVPEFGQFEPISAIFNENDDSRFTFTVKPADNDKAKAVFFAYVNADSGKFAFSPKIFEDKGELESYLNSLSDADIDRIKRELRKKTEG